MKRLALVLLALAAAVLRIPPAQAGSASYSTWILSGNLVTLRYVLPEAAARRLSGTDLPVLTSARLGDYLLAHVAVTAGGRDCPAIDQGYDLGRVDPLSVGPGLYGFEILFHCDTPAALVLHDHALFDAVPAHVDLARVERGGGAAQVVFTAGRQRLSLPDTGLPPAAGLSGTLPAGLRLLAGRADQYGLLLGLLLLARRWRDIGAVCAGLAAGLALVLALSLGRWVAPWSAGADALVGCAVLMPALAWCALAPGRARVTTLVAGGALLLCALAAAWLRGAAPALLLAGAGLLALAAPVVLARGIDQATVWLALGLVLGLVEGFALPPDPGPADLAGGGLLVVLGGFHLGALLGLAVPLAAGFAAVAALRRRPWPPAAAGPWIGDAAAAALGGLGVFWLLSRLYL